jgi:hypothetical protein
VIIEPRFPEIQLEYKWRLPFYVLEDAIRFFENFRKTFVALGCSFGDNQTTIMTF